MSISLFGRIIEKLGQHARHLGWKSNFHSSYSFFHAGYVDHPRRPFALYSHSMQSCKEPIQPDASPEIKSPTHIPQTHIHRSNVCLVRNRNDAFWVVVLHADSCGLPWHQRLTLKVDSCAVRLCLLLLLCVCLNTGEELISGSGFLDVLDADVDALLHVSVSDLLVEDDTDGGFGDVVDDTGLSVVNLVWHTLLDSTVCDYVHDIANPEGLLV